MTELSRTVIDLRSVRSLRAWVDLDLRRLSRRDRWIAMAAGALLVAGAFALAYAVYNRFGAPRNEYDLRIYYNALTSWHAGNDLYSYVQVDPVNGPLGFTYPPAAAILMSPMVTASIRPVILLSSLATFAATVAVALLALRERVRLRRPQMVVATGLATAFAFCLQPISQTAAYGQVNTILALLVMADLLVLAPRRSRWAGIGVGLAMAVKLTPAIFLLYLVLSRQWRVLRTAIGTAVVATGIGALCAPTDTWRYFTSLLWDSSRIGVLDNTSNQSINGTLARISAALPPERQIWAACVLIVVFVGARRVRRAIAAEDTLLAVTVTGFLGVLISPVSWVHHAVWILPAMTLLVARVVCTSPLTHLRRLWARLPGSLRDPSDPSARSSAERRATRAWLGTAVLTASGLVLFVLNTRNTFGLPDTGYAGLGVWAVIAGSIQTIWMLVAIAFLPIKSPAAALSPVAAATLSPMTVDTLSLTGTRAPVVAARVGS